MVTKLTNSFLAFVIAFTSVLTLGLAVKETASAQDMPPVVTGYSSISVRVEEATFPELFKFTTDLENDSLWFPNVESTEVIVKTPNLVGTQYNQVTYFGDLRLETFVEVKAAKKPFYYYTEATGPAASYKALYTYSPSFGRERGGVFTLSTQFVAPGLTEEALTGLLTLAMQNLLDYYQSEGSIRMNYVYIVE